MGSSRAPIPKPSSPPALRLIAPSARVLDVGTGCGAVALAIAAERPQASVTATDIGQAKVDSAAARIAALNPDTRLETIAARLDGPELDDVVAEADVVHDGTDSFVAR